MTEPKIKFNWELILLLWFAFFFNQADRQIFNVVLPAVKGDLQLSDLQLGMTSSAVILAIGIFIPVAGYFGDRFSKKRIIIFSVLIWTLATFFTGFSGGFLSVLILRAVVGGSEAFYGPAANALIGEKFSSKLGHAMAIHQTSLYAGIILSGIIGGYMADHYGWRFVFYIFGGIGVVLAFLMWFRLEDTKVPKSVKAISFLAGIKTLFANKTAILLTLGFSCMVFVNVGYLAWAPTFLHEKFGLSLTEAGFSSMFYHHLLAFAGVMFSGKFSDIKAVKSPVVRLRIQSIGLLMGAPFIFLIGVLDSLALVYVAFGVFGFFRGMFDSNIYASLFSVIPEHVRSSVIAAMVMIAYIFASIAPTILGFIKPIFGLSGGISSLSLFYLTGGLLILIGSVSTFKRDRERLLNNKYAI